MNESIGYNREDYAPTFAKWLHVLFLLKIITVVLSIFLLVRLNTIVGRINHFINIGIIIALFQMVIVNERYRKAAIFRCVAVGGAVVGTLMKQNILPMIASICSIVAVYQEFNSHAEVTKIYNSKLSEKWHSLFYWQFTIELVTGCISTVGVIICVLVGIDSPIVISVFLYLSTILSTLIELIYLKYIKETRNLFIRS